MNVVMISFNVHYFIIIVCLSHFHLYDPIVVSKHNK